jgi:hypothetical protein
MVDVELTRCYFLERCDVNYKWCPVCKNYHFYSYVVDDKTKNKHFYPGADTQDYFHFSNETFFESSLMSSMMADIFFKHSSFKAYANSYNFQFIDLNFARFKMDHRRLIDFFYTFQLVKYLREFYSENLISMSYLFLILNVLLLINF